MVMLMVRVKVRVRVKVMVEIKDSDYMTSAVLSAALNSTGVKMSIFDNIIEGKVQRPPKLLIWGPPAVGKSTFAAGADSPLFVEAENRTSHLDVSRLPVKTWNDVLDVIRAILKDEDRRFKTVVFDTVDAIETLLFRHIADDKGVESHEDIGGGWFKYRTPMLKQWKKFMSGIDKLSSEGIQCILLAHAHKKTYNPPEGQPYDRFVLKMDQAGGDFIVENVDLVGYAKFQVFVKKDRDQKANGKATTNGKRLLQFKFSPAYQTKQGVPCVDECELSWDAFKEGLNG
jgi:hypothetical protein